VCVCVCVRARVRVCVCLCERERECVCVCVCERQTEIEREYMCVCVRVCVCVCVYMHARACVFHSFTCILKSTPPPHITEEFPFLSPSRCEPQRLRGVAKAIISSVHETPVSRAAGPIKMAL
jgi:hypothetical protein